MRETARQGVDGQVGVASAALAPISTIRAEAGVAHTSAASSAPAAAMSLGRWGIPAFNTTDRPGLWSGGRGPPVAQSFETFMAFGPLSPCSSSYATLAPSASDR